MDNKFSLFDSHPFLKPLDAQEAIEIQKLLKWFHKYKEHIPGLALPDKMTDHMMFCFLKALNQGHMEINPKAWSQFLESMFTRGLLAQLTSPTLKNYLFIQLAKKQNLSRFLSQEERIKLAYSALHGGYQSRMILLMSAKHFEIDDEGIREDLAYKGILLGGSNHIELNQFMPLKLEVLKQLLFLINQIDKQKAELELEKLAPHFQNQHSSLKKQLRAI
jgi:hypothetical protein